MIARWTYHAKTQEFNLNEEITYCVVGNELLFRLKGLVLLQLGIVFPERFLLQLTSLPKDWLQIVVVLILILRGCCRNDGVIPVSNIGHILHCQLGYYGRVLMRDLNVVVDCSLRWWATGWRNIMSKVRGRSVFGWVDVVHVVWIVAWPWRRRQDVPAEITEWGWGRFDSKRM